MNSTIYDVIVVGGGAAGIMAAVHAAKNNSNVLILEHNDVLGKKILATGNGRCNFTNTFQGAHCYHSGDAPAVVLPAINTYTAEYIIDFFQNIGVMTVDKNGYCYPRTLQASTIRNALLKELKAWKIDIRCDIGIRSIRFEQNIFIIDTKSGIFRGNKCIIATGGMADPKSGSDGSGFIYARQLGHHISETVPALVPLISDAKWLKETKGVRHNAKVSLFINEEYVTNDQGEVQFTDYGISGIPVFQISRFATLALAKGQTVSVSIDFIPDCPLKKLHSFVKTNVLHYKSYSSLSEILSGFVNQKIADMIADRMKMTNKSFHNMTDVELDSNISRVCRMIKDTRINITGSKSFQQAQVTAGGILLDEIFMETMESKLISGLYFAGEIVDVDGLCGGYNLQWAWSSGCLAGTSAAKK